MNNNGMKVFWKNLGKTILRWLYIVMVYAAFSAPFYFGMQSLLENNMLTSPLGYSYNVWMSNISLTFLITLGVSLILILLWNLLFCRFMLGGSDMEKGINILNYIFLIVHLLLSAAALYYLLGNQIDWVLTFLITSGKSMIALALPAALIFPFYFATRLLAPEVISYRFKHFKKLRPRIFLTYY